MAGPASPSLSESGSILSESGSISSESGSISIRVREWGKGGEEMREGGHTTARSQQLPLVPQDQRPGSESAVRSAPRRPGDRREGGDVGAGPPAVLQRPHVHGRGG